MRLWHKDLIKALPQQHLVAQWRELSAIAGAIQKNGTPNHILVNFVLDYDYDNFISYAYYLREEMKKRKIRTMDSVWNKIIALKPEYNLLPIENIYCQKMDNTYLTIWYYNLFEKFLCGMFETEEMDAIVEVYKLALCRGIADGLDN